MARGTVEDCIENVTNRFELVILAAMRAKQISAGAPLTVERDNDKDSVVALREIAEKTISQDELRELTVQGYCRRNMVEDFEAAPFGEEMNEQFAEQVRLDMEANMSKNIRSEDDDDGFAFEDEETED